MSNVHSEVTGKELSLVNASSCAVGHLNRGCAIEQRRRFANGSLSPDEVAELQRAQREADNAALQSLRLLAQSAIGKGRTLRTVYFPFKHRDYDPDESQCGLAGHDVFVAGSRLDLSEGVTVLGIPSLTGHIDNPHITLRPMGGSDSVVIPLDEVYFDFDMLGPTGRRDLRDTVTAFRDIAYEQGV